MTILVAIFSVSIREKDRKNQFYFPRNVQSRCEKKKVDWDKNGKYP